MPSTPGHRVRGLAAVLVALVAPLVLGLLWRTPGGGSAWLATLVCAPGVVAGGLGAWIAGRATNLGAGTGAVSIGLLASSIGMTALALSVTGDVGGALPWVTTTVGSSAIVIAAGAAVRFSSLFPERLTAEALTSADHGGAAVMKGAWPVVRAAQSLRFWPGVTLVLVTVVAGAAMVPAGSPLRTVWLSGAAPIAFGGAVLAVAFAGALLDVSYYTMSPTNQRRLVWIRWGFLLALTAFVAAVGIMVMVAALEGPEVFADPPARFGTRLAYWAAATMLALAPLIFLASLAIAVLFDGALDPRLAIKRTTVYGSLSVSVLFLFGGLEIALSDYVLAAVGVPRSAAAWIAGGGVAVAFGPLKATLKRRVDRWVDRRLPATLLAESPRTLSVVGFADIVGYTAIASEDEGQSLVLVQLFHREADRASIGRGGKLVKTMGDGALFEFKSAESAIAALRDLHEGLAAACRIEGLNAPSLRIGLHQGEVAQRRDGDLFGDVVNVASRLQGVAEPDQLVVSSAVRADSSEPDQFRSLGSRRLKNVPGPVDCWVLDL